MDGERENEGRGMGEMIRNYERVMSQLPTYRELVKVIEAIQGPKWLNPSSPVKPSKRQCP